MTTMYLNFSLTKTEDQEKLKHCLGITEISSLDGGTQGNSAVEQQKVQISPPSMDYLIQINMNCAVPCFTFVHNMDNV